MDNSIFMHNFQNHNNFNNNSFYNLVFVFNFTQVFDNRFQWATITELHYHINIVIIRMRLIQIDKIIRSNRSELQQYLSLYERFVHFVYLLLIRMELLWWFAFWRFFSWRADYCQASQQVVFNQTILSRSFL